MPLGKEAAKAVVAMEADKRSSSKGGIYTQTDIEAIQVPKAKQIVKERYGAYVKAAKAFNDARDEMAAAKYNLQTALDRSLNEEEYFNVKAFEYLGLDNAENIIYRDSDQDYKRKFDRYVRMRTRRGRSIAVGKQYSWGWIDTDTTEEVKIDDFHTLETCETFREIPHRMPRRKNYRSKRMIPSSVCRSHQHARRAATKSAE